MHYRYPDAAAGPVGIEVCRNIVRTIRRNLVPPTPRTFEQLEEILPEHFTTRDNYRGRVNGPNGETAFIFISGEMLQQLNNAHNLLMDGTFRVTPRSPRFSQLFMIFLRNLNHVSKRKIHNLMRKNQFWRSMSSHRSSLYFIFHFSYND